MPERWTNMSRARMKREINQRLSSRPQPRPPSRKPRRRTRRWKNQQIPEMNRFLNSNSSTATLRHARSFEEAFSDLHFALLNKIDFVFNH